MPETGFEAESQVQSVLGILLTFFYVPIVGGSRKRILCRDAPLPENVASSRFWSVLDNDCTSSNILHRLLLTSRGHLSSIQGGSVG